jgi:imidazolonepropionase-like amidohydrolase
MYGHQFTPRWLCQTLVIVECCVLWNTAAAAQSSRLQYHHVDAVRRSNIAPSPLVFTGVTVVDVVSGQLRSGQVVVVSSNRIKSIGPASKIHIPAGARVVDAKNKYMIPGLWDMHIHIDAQAQQLYPRFIAHGITDLREMAQRFPFGTDSFRVWQGEVMAGTRVGPRVFGPSADYPDPFGGEDKRAIQDVLRTIDSLKAAGMIFLKYHDSYGDRDRFFAIAREARRLGFPMVGHVPISVTNAEAADSGLLSIEHINEQHQCWPHYPQPIGDSAAVEKRCTPAMQAYVRNGTWLVPTLAAFWPRPSAYQTSVADFRDALRMVRMMHRSGITKFLAGTDWAPGADPQFLPGLSAAEEVVFFVDAGFTPLEALQTGTLNPAKFFHATDSLGTVAAGKLADLVLLNSNPLADIHAVLKVWAVVANGRYFNRAILDSLDPIGTKPGLGFIPFGQRRERWYSANFIARTETTEVVLNDDLVTRYVALQKDLTTFWLQHAALHDTAKLYEDRPVVGVGEPSSEEARLFFRRVPIFDYVALAATDSALTGVFKKNDFSPEQYWPIQITLVKNVLRIKMKNAMAQSHTVMRDTVVHDTEDSVVTKNVAIVKEHKKDLIAAGIHF